VCDGAGKTHATSGPLEIGSVTADSVLAQATGGALLLQGAVSASGTGDAIVLVSDTFFLAVVAFSPALAAPGGRLMV
jgi:hypothetical protein